MRKKNRRGRGRGRGVFDQRRVKGLHKGAS